MREWQVYVVNEVHDWIDSLDDATHTRVVQAIDTLADVGPAEAVSRPRRAMPRNFTRHQLVLVFGR